MNIKVNNKSDLNRKARAFLLDHCISKRSAEILCHGFSGYINGDRHENVSLIREKGVWSTFGCAYREQVLSLSGKVESFHLTRNTILS